MQSLAVNIRKISSPLLQSLSFYSRKNVLTNWRQITFASPKQQLTNFISLLIFFLVFMTFINDKNLLLEATKTYANNNDYLPEQIASYGNQSFASKRSSNTDKNDAHEPLISASARQILDFEKQEPQMSLSSVAVINSSENNNNNNTTPSTNKTTINKDEDEDDDEVYLNQFLAKNNQIKQIDTGDDNESRSADPVGKVVRKAKKKVKKKIHKLAHKAGANFHHAVHSVHHIVHG